MARLSLTFLGTFQVTLDGAAVTRFRSSNVQGLLVYLALQAGHAISRDVLAALFWPDEPDSVARTNLRQTLYQLRKTIDAGDDQRPFLIITRQTAQFNPDSDYILDVEQFTTAVTGEVWETAVSHYSGELLPGFACDSMAFEAWLRPERERLHRQGLHALTALAEQQMGHGDLGAAQTTALRQLAIEPWRETAYQQLMRALALAGDRSAALAQFDRCYEALAAELGVEPNDETEALYEQIATGVIGPIAPQVEGLPTPPTSFVGRLSEIGRVVQTLGQPDCRLLTLVGAGGVGKTRLAVQVAHTFQAQTERPVHFVSLLGMDNLGQLLAKIGAALDLLLPNPQQAAAQIADALAGQRALLILDNAEPLVATAVTELVDFINTLTAAAPDLRIVATSRQPLQARQEWLLPLGGLTTPPAEQITEANWSQYDAITLFVQRAQQANATFTLSRSNLAEVAALCRRLDGLPLALELAAAQTARRTVAEILAAVADSPAALHADWRDLPPRHRSLPAVFDQSWELLTMAEQQVLADTAVFHNGFSRAAARAVLGDGADHLEALAARSLLRRQATPQGITRLRYTLSPLLAAHLRETTPVAAAVHNRHAAYFLDWAVGHRSQLPVERENVAAAWAWAQTQPEVAVPRRWNPDWLDAVAATDFVVNAGAAGEQAPVLVGREEELGTLREGLRPLLDAGQNGGLITVLGEAGIGKSYLLGEMQAEEPRLAWFICPCDEGAAQSLRPFRTWLRGYFGQEAGATQDANLAAFAARFEDVAGATADPELAAELTRLRSLLAALVDLQLPDSLYGRLQPEQRLENFRQAIKALVKAESRLQPLVVHVEDAHWLDADSRALVEHLLWQVADYPYAVVVSSRPVQFEPLVLLDVAQRTIRLGPLGETAVARLAAHTLGGNPDEKLVDLLLTRGVGNPFYTSQLLLYLRENGLVADGKLVRLGGETAVNALLPPDVHNLLVARLAGLDDEVRDVAERAAVLGHEFTLPLLRQLVDEEVLQQSLAAGVAASIWQPLAGERYVFNHALLRDAAYDTQFGERRRALHQEAARAVTAVATPDQPQYATIARHLDEAGEVRKAAVNYQRAGDQARDNYFIREAHSHYSRGLALAANDRQRLDLLLGREQVNHWLGHREQQQEDLRQLVALAAANGDREVVADVGLRQATFALVTGDYAGAVRHAQRTTSLAVGLNDRVLEARAMHRWARALWQQGKPRSAVPLLERALKLAETGDYWHTQATCLYDLSILAYYRDAYGEASQLLERAIPLFETHDDKRHVVRCVNMLGIIEKAQGNYETALVHYQRSVDLCQTLDWPYGEALMTGHLGNCHFELGNYALCRELHERALAISRLHNDLEGQSVSLDTIGLTYQFEGDLQTAREKFEAALAIGKELNNVDLQAYAATHLGLALTDSEEIEQASVHLYEAMGLRQDVQAGPVAIDTQAALAWLDLARGDGDFAADRAREIVTRLAEQGSSGVELPLLVYWQCYMILRLAGSTDEAEATLQAAYDLLQERAQRIEDDTLRQAFLTRSPYHRQIVAAWQAAG